MQDVLQKGEVPQLSPSRLEMPSERGLLIPQRLGRDDETASRGGSGLVSKFLVSKVPVSMGLASKGPVADLALHLCSISVARLVVQAEEETC